MSTRKRKAPKLGRPRLPKGESKSVFALRLNDAEREAIANAAERAGKAVSQWARDTLVERAAVTIEALAT